MCPIAASKGMKWKSSSGCRCSLQTHIASERTKEIEGNVLSVEKLVIMMSNKNIFFYYIFLYIGGLFYNNGVDLLLCKRGLSECGAQCSQNSKSGWRACQHRTHAHSQAREWLKRDMKTASASEMVLENRRRSILADIEICKFYFHSNYWIYRSRAEEISKERSVE